MCESLGLSPARRMHDLSSRVNMLSTGDQEIHHLSFTLLHVPCI